MKCPSPLFKIFDKFTKVIHQKQNFSEHLSDANPFFCPPKSRCSLGRKRGLPDRTGWQVGRDGLYLLLSSVLLIISFPKFNLFPLIWVALIPLFLAIKDLTPKKSFIFGFLTGFFTYLGLLYWIAITITTAGEPLFLGIFCLILLSAYLALYLGLFCLGFSFFTLHFSPYTLHFFSAFLWVSLEYLRSHLFTGFPWALLGYSQWNFLPIIQIAEFTGVYGVSFLIVLINVVLFQALTIKNSEFRIKNLVLTVGIFLLCLFYGFLKLKPITQSPNHPITCVLLQGNIDQYKKWSKEYKKEITDIYENLIKQTIPLFHYSTIPPSLIIWPESAIPGYLLYERHLYEWVKKIIQQSNCYHLIGSVHLRKGNFRPFATTQGETLTSSTVSLYNSVFLFSPEGKLLQEYDKIHPVPFGETIPLKDFLSKYIKVLNELGDFSSGKDYTVFHLPITNHQSPITQFSTNICFESIFPHLVRNFVKNGADIIVNLTNDAWFLKTSAPYQHFTMNIFRAVENRRYVVRCANTGISAFIDPYGRIIKQTPIFTALTLSGKIYIEDKKTFYTLYGDIFALFCSGFTLVFFVNLWYTKKVQKSNIKNKKG